MSEPSVLKSLEVLVADGRASGAERDAAEEIRRLKAERDLAQAKCAEMYSILTRVATCDPTLKGEEILASLKDNSGWE